eukprot:s696_g3.t1
MATGEEAAQAAGSGAYNTAVPWNQIPKFVPGETDLRTYTRKLEFLRSLWPKEQLEHLGPRAALAVEGVAFQKVSRLDPSKLREPDGVSYLVQALGGQWGKLDAEEKYDLFERALYQVVQKQDESHDSYLARHDAAFEDLLGRKVTLEEVRAYILMRQSLLSSDERKKVIMDSQGALTYENARKYIRLLGSRFFQDLQTGTGNRGTKYKTYDVNHVDEEMTLFHEEEEMDEEMVLATLAEEGDEDAQFVHEFEEQILVACQESSELAGCFMAYQEARSRLREKARSRGFWPLSGQKGRGKGKWTNAKGKNAGASKISMGSMGAASMGRRRSLADRIANSTCRRCGKAGHWKRECPLNASPSTDAKRIADTDAFTGIMTEEYEVLSTNETSIQHLGTEMIFSLPANATTYEDGELEVGQACQKVYMQGDGLSTHEHVGVCGEVECFDVWMSVDVRVPNGSSVVGSQNLNQTLIHRLTNCCRSIDAKTADAATCHREPVTTNSTFLQTSKLTAGGVDIFTAEEAADEAIIDTGASRAVIGSERLRQLVRTFPKDVRSRVMRIPTDGIVFKFGNAGRLSSEYAVLLPRAQNDWLRVEVVPGQTPFLISNAVLGKLRGIVDVEGKQLGFKGSEIKTKIPLFGVRKNLLGIKVMDLLLKTPNVSAHTNTHILHTQDHTLTKEHDTVAATANTEMHAYSHENHGGIQVLDSHFPKEKMSGYLQQNAQSHIAATVLSKQAVTPGENSIEGPAPFHGVEFSCAVPDQDSYVSGGRVPGDAEDLSRLTISSLETSGRGHTLVIPSGKHQTKTYATVYENDIWNRRAVAPWLRSFQLYCRQRREASVENQERETRRQGLQTLVTPHMTPEVAQLVRTGGAPWLSPRTNERLIKEKEIKDAQKSASASTESGWTHVSPQREEKANKRGPPIQNKSMEVQPNADKVAQIQAQIASLQRDLSVELNGTVWQEETTEDA